MPIMNDFFTPISISKDGISGPSGICGPSGVSGPRGISGVSGLSEQELREIKRQQLIKDRNKKLEKINNKHV